LYDLKEEAPPYIVVDNLTTKDEVARAVDLLKAHGWIGNPPSNESDQLTDVQCAVWYRVYGWSHEQIADTFSWSSDAPAYRSRLRSESARRHITRGVKLLAQAGINLPKRKRQKSSD
jgi:hypothetical protein